MKREFVGDGVNHFCDGEEPRQKFAQRSRFAHYPVQAIHSGC